MTDEERRYEIQEKVDDFFERHPYILWFLRFLTALLFLLFLIVWFCLGVKLTISIHYGLKILGIAIIVSIPAAFIASTMDFYE